MLKRMQGLVFICSVFFNSVIFAASVTMHFTALQGTGKTAGTVTLTETPYGLLFTPQLHGLTPGIHGFHIHEKASCDQNGMAAGAHFDPKKTGKHGGPYREDSHLGDLPAFYAARNGEAALPVVAPRIKQIADIKGHALMVHTGGDNYSDTPEKLGGGGGRMVCGIIQG